MFFFVCEWRFEAGDLLMEQVFLRWEFEVEILCTRRCHCIWWPVGQNCLWGASFEGANIDTKSCPDLQVAKKGLCIYDMYWSSVNLDFLTSWVVFVSWLLGTKWYPSLEKQAIRNGFATDSVTCVGKENPIQNVLGEMVEPVANQLKPQKSLNSHQNVGTSWMHLGNQ